MSSIEESERLAHEALAQLRRDYERLAEPYIEILCRIHAMRMPAIRITVDEAERLGLRVDVVETGK